MKEQKELELNESFPALDMFDVFKGQTGQPCVCGMVHVPANYTDKLRTPHGFEHEQKPKGSSEKAVIKWYFSRVDKADV